MDMKKTVLLVFFLDWTYTLVSLKVNLRVLPREKEPNMKFFVSITFNSKCSYLDI